MMFSAARRPLLGGGAGRAAGGGAVSPGGAVCHNLPEKIMRPSFNTAGPCVAGEHYLLSPRHRFARVMQLVADRKFFTIHAGRQTGKTTAASWLVDNYNAGDELMALWVDIRPPASSPTRSRLSERC